MHGALLVLAVSLPFWGALQPGPHDAGFTVIASQSAPGSAGWQPRPVEVAVWYPVPRAQRASLITFGEYFQLAADLRRRSAAGSDPHRALSASITGDAAALPAEVAERVLRTPMFAVRDAQPAASASFPVVMFSARYGSVAAQSVLAEYLASRGFVVAASWPKDAHEKLPFEAKSDDEKYEELDSQTDDIRGALRDVRALPYADDERAALIAWSYGGESAWQLAHGDARIELVIGLDSNVLSNWVYRPRDAEAAAASFPPRARFVEYGRATPEFRELAHGNFNALEGMIPAVMGIERVQRWSKAGAVAKRGYETVVRRVASTIGSTFSARPAARYTPVEFKAADGATVTADLYRAASNSRRCVALFHQSGSSRGEYRTIAPELARMGHTTLAVDVRWGERDRWNDVLNESAARAGTAAARERRDTAKIAAIKDGERHDLDAAVEWLQANGCSGPVIVWGASIQANGVLELAARRPDDIAAIVDVSPGEYAKDDPDKMKRIVKTVRTPALIVWGRTEESLSKPIFDALAAPAKSSYASSGRHGNSAFFEDARAWVKLREFLDCGSTKSLSRLFLFGRLAERTLTGIAIPRLRSRSSLWPRR